MPHSANLVLLGIVAEAAGNCQRPAALFMHEIAVAALTAAVDEAGFLQLRNEVANLDRQPPAILPSKLTSKIPFTASNARPAATTLAASPLVLTPAVPPSAFRCWQSSQLAIPVTLVARLGAWGGVDAVARELASMVRV
jgi:hypothetical protein